MMQFDKIKINHIGNQMDIIAAIEAEESNRKIFKIINKSENLNIVEPTMKNSALRVALQKNRKNVAIKLINKGIDVNIQNIHGDFALSYLYALWHEDDLINLLLEKKANVDLCSRSGFSPLFETIKKYDSSEIIKLLNYSTLINIEKYRPYYFCSFIDLVYKHKSAITIISHLKLLYRNSILESIDCDNTIISKCFKKSNL